MQATAFPADLLGHRVPAARLRGALHRVLPAVLLAGAERVALLRGGDLKKPAERVSDQNTRTCTENDRNSSDSPICTANLLRLLCLYLLT